MVLLQPVTQKPSEERDYRVLLNLHSNDYRNFLVLNQFLVGRAERCARFFCTQFHTPPSSFLVLVRGYWTQGVARAEKERTITPWKPKVKFVVSACSEHQHQRRCSTCVTRHLRPSAEGLGGPSVSPAFCHLGCGRSGFMGNPDKVGIEQKKLVKPNKLVTVDTRQ